jgi:DNA-binding TFAR19-related protein (PDSD5 family)
MSGDSDLELIKKRKMLEMMKRQLLAQARAREGRREEDIYSKLKPLMTGEAYNYLIKLRESKRWVADRIVQYLVYGLVNGLIPTPIDEIVVEYLERKIEGRSGKILVERRGELKSLEDIFRGR